MYHISHILFLLLCQSTVNDDRDLTIRSPVVTMIEKSAESCQPRAKLEIRPRRNGSLTRFFQEYRKP